MPPTTTNARVQAIAAIYRRLMWILLASFTASLLLALWNLALTCLDSSRLPATLLVVAAVFGMVVVFLWFVVTVAQVVTAIQACRAFDDGWSTLLFALPMIIPGISLLFLLVLRQRAATRLKTAGVRVGLFGVSWSGARNHDDEIAPVVCPSCGEPSASDAKNCPMCGTAV